MLGSAARLAVAVLASVLVWHAAPVAQQAGTLSPERLATVRQFADATTDAERTAIFAANAWLGEQAARTAVSRHGEQYILARRAELAENVFHTLAWLGEAIDNDRTRAGALAGLGRVAGQVRGDLPAAMDLTERSLVFAEASGDHLALQAPLTNLGILYRRLGDFERAAEYFARALAGAQIIKRADSLSRVYNNIGTLHYYQGNLALAREYFDRSIALKVDDGQAGSIDLANSLANVGILYMEVGDERQALEFFSRALDVHRRKGLEPSSLLVMLNIVRAYITLGELDEAERVLAEARPMAAAVDRVGKAQALYLEGLLARERGRLDEAIAFQQESLSLRLNNRDIASLADSHAESSNLMFRAGRLADAESEARAAIALAAPGQLLSQLAGAQFYLAQALDAQGRSAEALEAYEAAVASVERARDRALGETSARQVFLRQRLGPYTGLAALHARAQRPWEAMQTMEMARARTLLDILSHGRPPTRLLSDEVRRQERDVANAFAQSILGLRTVEQIHDISSEVLAQRKAELAAAEKALDAFQQQLHQSNPRLRLSRGGVPVLSRDALDTLVPAGTAAVQFVTDPNHAWAYLVLGGATGATVTAHRLSTPPEALIALGERFARQVSARDLGFAATSRQLYAALFGDIDAHFAGVRRLIVVPDNALWSVPFQALSTPRGKYLVEERALSYAPSLSALAALRTRSDARPDRAGMLVALGDPHEPGAAAAGVRGPAAGQLPEARREVQALGRLYSGRSTVLVGPDATEAALRAVASNASVVHIASHGILDDRGPMFSHLRLSPNPGDDGRLEAWELADMELSADLVVLSACETARGALGGGEGVIGLSWALLAAGASSAVLSQWEVDSASTTALMIAFHERLLKDESSTNSAPEALRQAALTMLKDPRYRHPFYWAGFIVMGS